MSDNKTTIMLYGGNVELTFDPNSTKYRYTVNDNRMGLVGAPVRGVTSVLKDIIAKPDLMTWPLNMANAFYFGAKFDETTKSYTCDWEKAALNPFTEFRPEELENMMMEGSRQWTKRSDTGKDVGTLSHAFVEHYLLSNMEGVQTPEPVDTSEASPENLKMAQKALKGFTTWWESLEQKKVLFTERPVYSRSMKYAGTFDLLAEINGKTYLLDLKTTNASRKAPLGIYAEYFLQLGAYSHAIREENDMQIDDVGIIRVGKDGRLHIATATDIGLNVDACERAFAFAARLHDFLDTSAPYLQDAHFKSHLIPSNVVDKLDSISK